MGCESEVRGERRARACVQSESEREEGSKMKQALREMRSSAPRGCSRGHPVFAGLCQPCEVTQITQMVP